LIPSRSPSERGFFSTASGGGVTDLAAFARTSEVTWPPSIVLGTGEVSSLFEVIMLTKETALASDEATLAVG
jgi:hypothetical protein